MGCDEGKEEDRKGELSLEWEGEGGREEGGGLSWEGGGQGARQKHNMIEFQMGRGRIRTGREKNLVGLDGGDGERIDGERIKGTERKGRRRGRGRRYIVLINKSEQGRGLV